MKKQLTEIWQYAQQIAQDENKMPEPPDFPQIDSQKVTQAIKQLNEKLSGKENLDRKVKYKLILLPSICIWPNTRREESFGKFPEKAYCRCWVWLRKE